MGSRLFAFEWCINILTWPILNVNVKVIRILIAKNSIELSHAAFRRTSASTLSFLVDFRQDAISAHENNTRKDKHAHTDMDKPQSIGEILQICLKT